jgi:hypothetical protein
MLPDDVFRARLEQTLVEIEAWAGKTRDCATIDVGASQKYWGMLVIPHFHMACPFELIIKSGQKFSLKLADEAYEDRPVEHFDLFPALARAIEAGHVERIEIFDAATDTLVGITTRVALAPGWDWIGERRIAPPVDAEECRTQRFLSYRR